MPQSLHLPGAGDGSSSFLESRILRLCLRRISGFPRLSSSSIASRSVSRSPRFLNLPAAPAMVLRVSSSPASFSGTGGEAPGCPESSLLQHRLSMSLRVSPDPASSGCADGEFPGIPDSSLHRLRRLVDFRVSPDATPYGCSVYAFSSVPESCIHGWVDDDSPA